MKKLLIVLVFFPFYLCGQITYSDYFTEEVLRIDYERSGNMQSEQLQIIGFKKQNLWSGCRNNTIEPWDYGDYKIELTDIKTGALLYTFSYSSLFAEYIYTETGRSQTHTFQETVRVPFPKFQSKLNFYKREMQSNAWTLQLSIDIDPEKVKIQAAIHFPDLDYKKIHDSGDPVHKADIVFVAEGYTIDQQNKFWKDADRIAEYLNNCRPFDLHTNQYNIWAVFAPSLDKGVTDPSGEGEKNTVLGSNFSTFGTDRYLMTEQLFTLHDVISDVPYDHIVIIANGSKYGGGGIYNFYAAITSDCRETPFLLVHEFGHSFAGLADEYYTSEVSVIEFYPLSVEPWEPNITTLVNFDLKWKSLIEPGISVPTEFTESTMNKVGVFEGAGYAEKGVYRPFNDCTMKSVKYNAFCPVCRASIVKILDYYSE